MTSKHKQTAQKLMGLNSHLLDVLQRLNDSDVVQVDPACRVPVLDGGAVFRDRQPLQELQQEVMVVVDDAVWRQTVGQRKAATRCASLTPSVPEARCWISRR